MHKEGVTKQAVKRVLRDYWDQYKKYPGLTLGSFLLPGLGSIFVFFIPPLIISRIVNILARDGAIPFNQAGVLVLLFGGLWLFGELCWRVGMYFLTRLEAPRYVQPCREELCLFDRRDYDFFTSKFVGSLTKKAQAYTKNFEGFTDTFSFNITPNILPMVFALIILARYSIWISLLLLVALAVVVILTIPLIRARSKIVAERHDASSKMTGNLSDILHKYICSEIICK
jgi:ATP-binding cassette subfamily B protein